MGFHGDPMNGSRSSSSPLTLLKSIKPASEVSDQETFWEVSWKMDMFARAPPGGKAAKQQQQQGAFHAMSSLGSP